MRTRTFAAGAASFVVECPSTRVRNVVETLLADLIQDSETPSLVLRLTQDAGMLAVHLADGEVYPPQAGDAALATLVTAITRLALDREPGLLHLHAAAVALDGGRGLLLPAQSGSGKTTLTATLVQRGWAYVSDESVAIDAATGSCTGFPKPLTFKQRNGYPIQLPNPHELGVSLDDGLDDWWPLPASALTEKIDVTMTPSTVAVLLAPADLSFDVPPSISTMHPTDAVVAMMSQTMDAERYGPHTVQLLARLAGNANCVTLRSGHLDAMVSIVEELALNDPPDRYITRLDPERTSERRWKVPDTVCSMQIDDRVVAHDTASGNIVALDDAGSAVWLAIHGHPPSWWSEEILLSRSTISFVDQLIARNLVTENSIVRTKDHR